MKIAVLSGKGGTGKTFVSVNLAKSAEGKNCYADCDVEEPNGHLFLNPENIQSSEVNVKIPLINQNKCIGCRTCTNFCAFNALAFIGNKVMLFDNLCHSCGGCVMLCKQKAITEVDRSIGVIKKGNSGNTDVITGLLNTGEASGVKIIKDIYDEIKNYELSVIDCPPGSACIVMESIKDADYCLLVLEPTLFGLHNFKMVLELVTLFKKNYGIIINKATDFNNVAKNYCVENNLNVIGEIPFSKKLAMIISEGKLAVQEDTEYKKLFNGFLNKIIEEAE